MSAEELAEFMDCFNEKILEIVSSSDVNDHKGGVMAISKKLLICFLKPFLL